MDGKSKSGLKAPAFSALGLAFASFGDAFLYAFLPVNFNNVGVSVMWVGLLLSINRFVRILSNTMIVHAYAKHGLRTIMIIAVLLAITSTLGYSIASGLVLWILFRIMWGLAFSAMRIGMLGYALQHERIGFALGLSRCLYEAGPMMALALAPLLLVRFDSRTIFFVLAFMSLPAIYFAMGLPKRHDKTPALESRWILGWPSSLNSITLISSIIIDGIIVVVLGVLFIKYKDGITMLQGTTLAAFYLAYRRACLVLLSPAGGWIADRIGMGKVFNLSLLFLIIGLIVMVFGWIGTGVTIVFTFYGINAAITPGSASKGNSHTLAAVAENATWRDIGAAVGTLIGGVLISSVYLDAVLQLAIFVMSVLFFVHLANSRDILKQPFLWK